MADQIIYIDPDGIERPLGNIRPPAGLAKAWMVFGDTPSTPMIARTEWKDRIDRMGGPTPDYRYLPEKRKNQSSIGMCNASATGSAMETTRAKNGLPPVLLSGGDLYHRICYRGGDNGSLLEDGLAAMLADGIAPVSVVPYLDWRNNYPAAPEARKGYRVLEAFLCPTFDHVMSASIQGLDLISGVAWFQNYIPGADGWLPYGQRDVGGHAVHTYRPAYRLDGSKIEYGTWNVQSWGDNYGPLQARFVMSEFAYTRGMVGGWWAIRVPVDEGGVVPPVAG